MADKCNIILDILPLYVEKMASEDSAKMIEEHIKICNKCREALGKMQINDKDSDVSEVADESRNVMGAVLKRVSKRLSLLYCSLMMTGIFFGLGLTIGGSELFYNVLIMPFIGALGYAVFRFKAFYTMPLLLVISSGIMQVFRYMISSDELIILDLLSFCIIYCIFIFAGITVAALIRYASDKTLELKKHIRIIFACISGVLLVFLCLFANALIGNPVSKTLVKLSADERLETVYKDTDYEIESVSYSFKDGCYYVSFKSPTSLDGDFKAVYNILGKLRYDTYESRVLCGANTADRLYFEYRGIIDSLLESPLYPYKVSIGYGDLKFSYEAGVTPPENALLTSELTADRFYNISELAKNQGYIVLYVEDETVTPERAAEILLETKRLANEAGITFYAIDFVLEYPRKDDNSSRPSGRIEADNLLYVDITPESIIGRLVEKK